MANTIQQYNLWQRLRVRLIALIVIGVASLLVLLSRIFWLQLVQGATYYEKSQRVIRKVVPMIAPRGEFFDRNYTSREDAVTLVSNLTSLNLVAIPSHFRNKEELTDLTRKLETILRRPAGSLTDLLKPAKIQKNEEIILIEKLSEAEHTIIADYYLTFAKFIVQQTMFRNYKYGSVLAHVTGYVGPPTEKDIEAGIESYQSVGRTGLEAVYDGILRGSDGEIVQIRTAAGDVEEQKVFRNFTPGNNLVLTIDLELQKAAEAALRDRTGGLLAIRPDTGEILALVSKPDYDPNILISSDKVVRSAHLQLVREGKGELNRVISAKYPPASTYKPLVALAALEEKKSQRSMSYFCPGKFVLRSSYRHLPDSTFHCWSTHGSNDLTGALANSCSVYFYELGYRLGSDPIIRYSRYFELDKKSGLDLPGEIPGFIPTPAWKDKTFNTRWFDGDTVNLSIGQGFIETTLAGMVNFYAALVNNGVVYRPHLIKEIRFAENDKIKTLIRPERAYEIPVAKSTLDDIREGLRAVVTRGTARGVLQGADLPAIAGKTGTVQTRSGDRFANATQHAWFIGWGPYDGPDKLLVGVFVERGQGGAVGAAPAAREVFRTWQRILKRGAS